MKHHVSLLMGFVVTSMAWMAFSSENPARIAAIDAQTVTATPRSTPLLRPVISVTNSSQVVEIAQLKLDGVYGIAWSPDGRTLAATSSKGVWLYSVDNLAKSPQPLGNMDKRTYEVAYSPDGTSLAVNSGDAVEIWDVKTGKRLLTLDTTDCGTSDGIGVRSIVFSPDGSSLAFCCDGAKRGLGIGWGGSVRLWNARTGKQQTELAEYQSFFDSIDFHPNGRWLASTTLLRAVLLWNLETRVARTIAIVHTDWAPVKFSPGGSLLAFGDVNEARGGRIRLWDTVRNAELTDLQASEGELIDLAFSPDGTLLAAGGFDNVVRLWDVKAVRQRMALTANFGIGGVFSLAFSPGGRLLASAGADGTIRLWGVAERN